MKIEYVYHKKRSEFGRQCRFTNEGPDLIDNYPSNTEFIHDYILRDPESQGIQTASFFNTTKAEYVKTGINHTERGWNMEHGEEQTNSCQRKIKTDDSFNPTIMQLYEFLEAKLEEIPLKMKNKSDEANDEESETELEKKDPSPKPFMDANVLAAEKEFFRVIRLATVGPDPEIQEEEDPEPEPGRAEQPTPPPLPTTVAPSPAKKKSDKGGAKKKK